MSSCNKTPVAVLHELCVRRSIVEQYNLVAEEGTPNDKRFEMSVETSSGLLAFGSGKTKKEAKHNAAEAALKKMKVPAIMPGARISSAEGVPPVVNPHKDRGSTGNAVGCLQEYCAVNGLPAPVYELTGDEGEPHNRIFSMKCEVSQRYETGIGRTKQMAKHNAAQAMYTTLRNNPSLSNRQATIEITPSLSQEERQHIIDNYFAPLSNVPTTNPGLKFSCYNESMRNLLSPVKEDLTTLSFSSPEESLKTVAEKLALTVSFHEMHDDSSEHPNGNEHYVYAVVNTQPITVQLGKGQSSSTAETQAALRVLRYWQIFVGVDYETELN